MPIYEYRCSACQHQFDLLQKMTDPVSRICPKCIQETAVRLVSAAGFQLKGTGWYATDFKDKGKPPQNASKAETAPKADASSGVKSPESKGDCV